MSTILFRSVCDICITQQEWNRRRLRCAFYDPESDRISDDKIFSRLGVHFNFVKRFLCSKNYVSKIANVVRIFLPSQAQSQSRRTDAPSFWNLALFATLTFFIVFFWNGVHPAIASIPPQSLAHFQGICEAGSSFLSFLNS